MKRRHIIYDYLLFCICAFIAIIGTTLLCTTNYSYAKDGDEGLPKKIVKVEGLPEGTHLVTDSAFNGYISYEEIMTGLFGNKYSETFNTIYEKIYNGEIEPNSEEFNQIIFNMFEESGVMFPIDYVFEFYLEDDDNHEVVHDGSNVTISFFYADAEQEQGIESSIQQYSAKKWERKIAHFTDNGIEYLDVIEEDGIWQFTTTSFSAFAPVFKAIEESEASPQTLDNSLSSLIIITISISTIVLYGIHLKATRR